MNYSSNLIHELELTRHQVPEKVRLRRLQERFSTKATLAHDVKNHANYAYSTQLYIGSHHQPVSLLLDTGSSIMWVQSKECQEAGMCDGDNPYDHWLSDGYAETQRTQTIEYGIGKVVGKLVSDEVSWVPDPLPHQLGKNVPFLIVNEADMLNTLNQDGLVGLAPSTSDTSRKTLIEAMYEQGLLRDMTFSLYLGLESDKSKIWLGGYDRQVVRGMAQRYKPDLDTFSMSDELVDELIEWLPQASDYYWMAPLSGAEIGGETWRVTAESMIFDSGSTVNHIPTKEYNLLLNEIVRDHECQVVMNP